MSPSWRFKDRRHAGRVLARLLAHHGGGAETVVMALPRGGVAVGYEIAHELHLRLGVFVVRKLRAPGHEELALGAVATGGARFVDEHAISLLGLDRDGVAALVRREEEELARREQLYLGHEAPPALADRIVILVDDGLATGSTLYAAAVALRLLRPAHVVMAVPASTPATCRAIADVVDEIVCAVMPESPRAAGIYEQELTQLSDDQARELLDTAARESERA